jgi:GT2 family glycosyltransferase
VTNSSPAVAICIVTHNDAADLPGCFAALGRVIHRPLEVIVVDCASRDGSSELARREAAIHIPDLPLQVVELGDNRGFAGGMNVAFARTEAPFVMTLNADAHLGPDYVTRLLERVRAHPGLRVGGLTGRLLRFPSGQSDNEEPRLSPERVFGATGAAALFNREALLDVAVDGEIFDSRFHTYREDAELCFRLRERGWEILYEPAALAEHRRFNLPERRSTMPEAANYNSLKNRYLLRLYHQTGRNFLRTVFPTLGRDLVALAYVLLKEHSSLPAYAWLWRHRREILRWRRIIQGRRTVPPAGVDRWFHVRGEPL